MQADDAQALLSWYAANRRDLPWRRTRDPWAVLVSEVLLQQTRVETVLSRYPAFLARFPTPGALAEASEADVLLSWQGLGYYRRARNLHAAARAIAASGFPRTARGLAELPGVGPYTAAAVAAIAFGERELGVDGNVDRVLSRYLALDDPSPARRRREILARVAPPGASGDFLQALFDLGSAVCAPTPRCEACPLAASCAARNEGRERDLPPKARRGPARTVHVAAALIERGERVLLVQHEGPFLGGLWGLPHAEAESRAAARSVLAASVEVGVERLRYEHVFSHKRWRVVVYDAAPSGACVVGRWHRFGDLPAMPEAWAKALRGRGPSARAPDRSP